MNKTLIVIYFSFLLSLVVISLTWQRDPITIFESSMKLPMNVRAGDLLITNDGHRFVFQESVWVTAVNATADKLTITTEKVELPWSR